MNVKFVNPFVEAPQEILQAEASLALTRGDLELEKTPFATDEVTVILSLVGRVEGNVFYCLTEKTALWLTARLIGQPFESFSGLAQSGIAELSNMITERARAKLAGAGYAAVISPPTLLLGKGATISTLDLPRLVVPLASEQGIIKIHLALREGSKQITGSRKPPDRAI